jgi:hypothetical protein
MLYTTTKKHAGMDLEGSSRSKRALENRSLKCGSKLKFKFNTLGSIGLDPLSRDRDKRPAPIGLDPLSRDRDKRSAPMDTLMNPRVSQTVKIV